MDRPDIKRLPKHTNPLLAQKRLQEALVPPKPPVEFVPLPQAFQRILAEDAVSNINIPSYEKTFIDGYAINPAETKGATINTPAVFKVVGKLFPADYPTATQVSRGEAVYVACGAAIPEGAYATVKAEETRLKDGEIEVNREITVGEGIIPVGEDVKKDAVLLKKGQILRSQDVGLLASIGFAKAPVFKKPSVAILSGGDELIRQTQRNPEVIANNYALVISGLAMELGAQADMLGIMPDDSAQVQAKIADALVKADMVITIGGSSVGVKDFVPDAVNVLGKPGVVLQGISLKPGGVSGFGIVDGKPVIMLPGHIGSCIAGFYLLAAPTITTYTGFEGGSLLPTFTAELAKAVDSGPLFRFLLLHIRRFEDKLIAEPIRGASSALTTIAKSNGYTILPSHTELAAGSKVDVCLFSKSELIQ